MAAYLTLHPPVRDQWYPTRNRRLTGCTVLHSAENAFDEMGEDTGAEGVAAFCQRRTTPGSYHDIVDSDSDIHLVEYGHGAYHDGTGSNNWALSLSFALRTTDWRRMSPVKRKQVLRRGAKAFLRQQAWRRENNLPLTELRLISKAESDAGMSGFTYHGWRDPGRRSDPGTIPPDVFPFDEFVAEIRALMGGGIVAPPLPEVPDMILMRAKRGAVAFVTDISVHVPDDYSLKGLDAVLPVAQVSDAYYDAVTAAANSDERELTAIRKALEELLELEKARQS